MKGNDEVIQVLNEVLTSELTAINQYFIHSKMCEDWGFEKLAAKKRAESIEETAGVEEDTIDAVADSDEETAAATIEETGDESGAPESEDDEKSETGA